MIFDWYMTEKSTVCVGFICDCTAWFFLAAPCTGRRLSNLQFNFLLLALFDEESKCKDTKKLTLNLESAATNRPKSSHHPDDPIIARRRLIFDL